MCTVVEIEADSIVLSREPGSDGVALGTVATARDGYLKKKPGLELSMSSKPGCVTGGPIN